jgi:rod shape determining protein RodA
MIDRRLLTNFDWTLFGLALLIAVIGVVNIYSATASFKLAGSPFFLRQVYWITFGIFLMITVCSVDYHVLEDISYWVYGLLIFLLLVVLVAGRTSMGATRWLHLGFVNIQPSEPMKIVIIMVFARYFTIRRHPQGLRIADLGYPLLFLGAPALLIMKQPDLGTAIMVILIAFSLMIFVGVRWAPYFPLSWPRCRSSTRHGISFCGNTRKTGS